MSFRSDYDPMIAQIDRSGESDRTSAVASRRQVLRIRCTWDCSPESTIFCRALVSFHGNLARRPRYGFNDRTLDR